ncbi:MAG: DUF2786 domain-containing protein [Simkaniaceae bacterium]|nr:DUF2786 domain-containing protein [Simkaniaceae bacterium]
MIIYSSTYLAFIKQLEALTKHILQKEMSLRTRGDRFYFGNFSYPLRIIIFDDPGMLGYFHANFLEIGINKIMITEDPNSLSDLIKHELAHYMVYIKFGKEAKDHGVEFRTICKNYGWGPSVYQAKMPLQMETPLDEKTDSILSKVKKLLALSASSNAHESQAATLKVNALLEKYNLENISQNTDSQDEMHLLRTLEIPKTNAKIQTIALIARTFFVFPVMNRGKNSVYLELFGNFTNVKIADYVVQFLNEEMERLWIENQKANPGLKGLSSKNSFFRGLGSGFLSKQKQTAQSKSTSLVIEKSLERHVNLFLPKLSKSVSSYKHCDKGSKLGAKAGKNLHIHPAVSNNTKEKRRLQY